LPIGHSSTDRGGAGISFAARRPIEVTLNDEVMAAVEGWRQAHGLSNQSEALGELVRLGLMSEIGRIYRMATSARDAALSGLFASTGDADDAETASRFGPRQPQL
jgi:hypothetical protein